jgi:dTDP-4-amino-4,6-dideoxygalactose transaminase
VIATQDAALADRLAALRQYGWKSRYISDEPGVNSRLDEVQAAILRVKLTHLDAQNARRRAIAAAYDDVLSGENLRVPARRENLRVPARRTGAEHVFHLYVTRAPERTAIQTRLREMGIGTAIHYPVPVHLQPAYHGRVALGPNRCRETERASAEVLSLPMFPQMSDAQVGSVCDALSLLHSVTH